MIREESRAPRRHGAGRGLGLGNMSRIFVSTCVGMLVAGAAGIAVSQMTSGSRMGQVGKPLPPGLRAPKVDYRDIAVKAGLTGRNVSGSETQQAYIVENTGAGVAIFDYDNDGLPDVLLVNGDRFTQSQPRPGHFLYRNLGGLRFEDVTARSGIIQTGWGQGACVGDIDTDGYLDLLITNWGTSQLYRNQGYGRFRDETKQCGLDGPRRWGTGCTFLDYDRDGDLDLFIAHYVDFDPAKVPKPGMPNQCMWKGFPVACGPMGLPPETMSLYRNDGRGYFTDVSVRAGITGAKAIGLTALSGDFNSDGWADIYVTGDSTPSLHFLNKRDGTFEEIGVYSGVAYNEHGREQSGMGAWAGDYDRDGKMDILKTNFEGDFPNLFRNIGDGTFMEVTSVAGLSVHTEFVSWGCAFLDFDADGWKDIFIANGHVYPDIDGWGIGQSFRQRRLLYWNRRDGALFDLSPGGGPGIVAKHSSRGVAVADLDNDGHMEIVVVNMHESPSLLKNFGERGNSLLVRALTSSGRDAIGARLTLNAGGKLQVDEVRSGGYYMSQGDLRVHFGLGSTAAGDLTIRWPDGKTETFGSIKANQIMTIQQGKGVIRTQRFTVPAAQAVGSQS